MSDAAPPMPPGESGSNPVQPGQVSPPEMAMPDPPTGKKRRRVVALVLVVALVAVAGTASAAFFTMRGSGEQLMAQVPAGADIVVTAYLDPAASQKMDLFRMAARFPGGSESQILSGWNELLDQALASAGLNHNDLGWVGSQVALEASLQPGGIPSAAFLIDATDTDAAGTTLQALREGMGVGAGAWHDTEYKGVTVSSSGDAGAAFGSTAAYAVVGDTVVLGTSTQAVDEVIETDQGGASVLDSADFQAAVQGLPEGRLVLAYVRPQDVLAALRQQLPTGPGIPGPSFQTVGSTTMAAVRGVGMTLAAGPDGLAMDINVAYDSAKLPADVRARMNAAPTPNALTALIPADAYGVALQQHAGESLRSALAQLSATDPEAAGELEDAGITGAGGLLDSLTGDVAVALLPGSSAAPVSGLLVLGSSDGGRMQKALDRIRSLAATTGSTTTCSASSGGVGHCHSAEPPEWASEDYRGTRITYLPQADPSDPVPAYAVVDGAAVVGTSRDAVEAVIDTQASGADISTSPAYTAAIAKVPSSAGIVFLNVPGLLASIGSTLEPDARAALDQGLGAVTAVVAGGESDASHQHVRLLIEIP